MNSFPWGYSKFNEDTNTWEIPQRHYPPQNLVYKDKKYADLLDVYAEGTLWFKTMVNEVPVGTIFYVQSESEDKSIIKIPVGVYICDRIRNTSCK